MCLLAFLEIVRTQPICNGSTFFNYSFYFVRTSVLSVGRLIPLLWTSGDSCCGFQSQGWTLTCMLPVLHAMYSSDSPLVRHLLTSWWPAWQLSLVFITIGGTRTHDQASNSVRTDRLSNASLAFSMILEIEKECNFESLKITDQNEPNASEILIISPLLISFITYLKTKSQQLILHTHISVNTVVG